MNNNEFEKIEDENENSESSEQAPKKNGLFGRREISGDMRYTRARGSLMLVVILSIVNLFALTFADTYFLFSSYITLIISAVGAALWADMEGATIILVATVVVGIISVLPYLACWHFSKKHVGWLIAGLVLFAIDTILLVVDSITALDVTSIIDIAIHGYIIYELVSAVKYGLEKKNQSDNSSIE